MSEEIFKISHFIIGYYKQKMLAYRKLIEYAIEEIEKLECDQDNSDLGCERRISGDIRRRLNSIGE